MYCRGFSVLEWVSVAVEDELESSGRVTVSILSLLSVGRLGFSLQSFRDIHRTEMEIRIISFNKHWALQSQVCALFPQIFLLNK